MIIDKITYDNMAMIPQIKFCKDDFNVDVMKLKKALNCYNDLLHRTADDSYGDIHSLLKCIGIAIERSEITDKQNERLLLWLDGMQEKDIAKELELSQVTVHNSLVQSVKKIAVALKEVVDEWF